MSTLLNFGLFFGLLSVNAPQIEAQPQHDLRTAVYRGTLAKTSKPCFIEVVGFTFIDQVLEDQGENRPKIATGTELEFVDIYWYPTGELLRAYALKSSKPEAVRVKPSLADFAVAAEGTEREFTQLDLKLGRNFRPEAVRWRHIIDVENNGNFRTTALYECIGLRLEKNPPMDVSRTFSL